MARGRRGATATLSEPEQWARTHAEQLMVVAAGPVDLDWRVRNSIAHMLEEGQIEHATQLRRAVWASHPQRAPSVWDQSAAEPFDERLGALLRVSGLRARDRLMAGGSFDLLAPEAGYESLARELSLPRATGDDAERTLAMRAPSRGLGDLKPAASAAAWHRGIRAMARAPESIEGSGDLRSGMALHLPVERPHVLYELAREKGWGAPILLISPREDDPETVRVWVCLERPAHFSVDEPAGGGYLALRAVFEATEARRDSLPMMIDAQTAPWQLARVAGDAITLYSPSGEATALLESGPIMRDWSGEARAISRPDWRHGDPTPSVTDISTMLGREEFCAHERGRWGLPEDGDALMLSCDLCGRRQVAAVPLHRIDPADPALPDEARAAVEEARRSPSKDYLRAEATYRFISDPESDAAPPRAEDLAREPTIPLRRSDWVTGGPPASPRRGKDLHAVLADRRRS